MRSIGFWAVDIDAQPMVFRPIAAGTPLVCCLRVNYVENKGTGVGGTDAASDRERYGL